MKTKFLFPNHLKQVGWIILIPSAILGVLLTFDILGFEFEMGLFPNILDEVKNKGIDLAMKYIPRDVFDKRAVEKNQVVFHDVSYMELKPHIKSSSVAIELTDFSVFYNHNWLIFVMIR